MPTFSRASDALVQYGTDYLTAVFRSTSVLTVSAAHGSCAINGLPLSSLSIPLGQVGNLTYQLEALPDPGYVFSHWTTDDPFNVWIADSQSPLTSFQLNGSAALTPHFVRSPRSVAVAVTVMGHGAVTLNAADTVSGSATLSLGPTTY